MKTIEIINGYANKIKKIQELILEYIENDDSSETSFQNLINYFDDQKISNNKPEFKTVLHLISKITDNHHRKSDYFSKIEQILKRYQENIKSSFTNFDIFNIFKSNKRVLLFLFEEKIVIPDKSIAWIISNGKYKEEKYPQYFFTEFKALFDKKLVNEIISETEDINDENLLTFEENRKRGMNSNYICKLIQNDSIDDFVTFYTRTNFSLSSTVHASIYETNLFLINNEPSLIEYAAFFGSIQIFKYLYFNKVDLNPSLWLYVIHGQNPELIHFLEENHVKLQNDKLNQCFDESVKCHHIEFTNYIKDNYFDGKGVKEIDLFSQSLRFYNFIDFCTNNYTLDDNFKFDMFYELCKYDYVSVVELLIKDMTIKINSKKI